MIHHELRQFLDLLPEPVLIVDNVGVIQQVNQAVSAWLKFDGEEFCGRSLQDFLVVEPAEFFELLDGWNLAPPESPIQLKWRMTPGDTLVRNCLVRQLPSTTEETAANLFIRCEAARDVAINTKYGELSSDDPEHANTQSPAHDASYLAAIVEASLDAIIGVDLQGTITCWNPAAERIFGYNQQSMLGSTLAGLIPDDRRLEESRFLEAICRGEKIDHFETVRKTSDGRLIDVSVAISPLRDEAGRIVGASSITSDITALKSREKEVARLTRLYAALSQVNQAIVWTSTREELLQKICRVLVDFGGFRMAWIGWHDAESHRILPVAQQGDEFGYLESIAVYGDDRPEGRGPTGTAFRTGQPAISNDMLTNPASAPWRAEFEQRGFRASAAFPIRHQDHVCAVLSVYAEQSHFFQAQEIALLEEAAMDVSFALDNFTRDEARRQAEQTLRQERDFSESVLDSLPGVLYLYDENGRFVRWNKNFEKVTGYHPEEIAKLHPLDFFAGQDKERVADRISEVFQSGSSQIEAELVVRNGEALPYVFTGVTTRIDGKACLVGVGIDVSERRRAELARLESESRYRTLFDYAPDGILIADSKSRYQDANPSICRMLGYSRDELIGLGAADIIADSHQPLIEPTLDMIAKQEQVPREWHFRRKDGSQFSAEVIATLMPEGQILGMIRDITERKLAEAKLRESESHLRDAQRIARLGSWEHTLSDGSLRWSDQIYVIFGLDRSQFQGSYQAFLDRVHPEDREYVEAAQKLVLSTGGRLDIEHRVVLPDGKVRHVHEMADVLTDESGKPISLAGTVLDITDRKRAEREREKRHQAEAADRIKSAFLATMSHELRTPLNSIIGFTSIILQELPGPLNAEQRKQLEMVRGSARHLLALVNDVLDISKIEAGQLEVVPRLFDLRSSIEKVVATMRPAAAQKNLDLRVELSPEIGMLLNDERRLEQILLNLLSNAIKFTDNGHVALRVETAREHQFKGSITSERVVCFLVSDTGIGIQREDLNSLFQPFRQIDTGLARVHEGTGLGLAICHRLAVLMGGEVHAESHWGVGSTFCLTLPLNDGAAS